MSTTSGIPQPGVEVIQVFQTVNPTVITPTLVPCIIGPCKQVVEAVVKNAAGSSVVNAQALTTLPAFFVAKAPSGSYTLNGDLKFTSSGLPLLTVTFASGNYAPSDVVSKITAALEAVGESDLIAEVFGTSWRLRTIAETDFASILIDPASTGGVLTAFGLVARQYFQGASAYEQYQLTIPTSAFPDPNNNLDEVVVDSDTVRVFLGLSGGAKLVEELRNSTVLRHGGAVTVVDAGNGTGFSNILEMTGEDFTAVSIPNTAATATAAGIPDFTNLAGTTLTLSDGRVAKTIAFGGVPTLGAIQSYINQEFNALDGLVVTDNSAELIFTSTRLREDGITTATGEDSQFVILGGSAVTPVNYLDTGVSPVLKIGRFVGKPMAAKPGDQLWVDGVMVGLITAVAPNSNIAQLKINANLSTTFTGTSFYIVATNLTAGSTTRPRPDLVVDGEGNATLKHGLLRDTTGKVVESVQTTALVEPKVGMYVSYHGLRLDVTQAAKNPGLLQFSDPATLQSQLAPISVANPLGLGLFFAMLNAPAVQITGIGVDEVSEEEPDGTVEGYTRAVSFLEQFEVYALAPLTHDDTVGQVFQAHVDAMSAPDQKGERIVLLNPSRPTRRIDTLVASGTNGNTIGGGGLTFDTGIPNLGELLLAQGIDPTVSVPVADGLYVNIASSSSNFNVSAVSGSVLTLNDTFTGSQNSDGFYSGAPMTTPQIEEAFSLKIRGAALVLTDGVTPDKANIAATYAAMGASHLDRRVWQIVPDTCAATLGGVEQQLPGFYLSAGIAGMIGQQPPQQSFTNFPMTGYTRAIGSNDFFTPAQLNQMAGGGCYTIVQDIKGKSALYSRMALTTDTTSIETRTDEVTKVVDFCAKFLRTGLKNFIGRFNITQGLLDSLGHVLEGLKTFLIENSVLIGATINNIIQDTSAPDTVLIDITLDVPLPCNYIRLTLVV